MGSVSMIPVSWQESFLAMDSPVDADLVVGVPESGNAAAHGIFPAVGIPYGNGICQEWLCRQNLHQAEAEEQRVQCTGQIKCIKEAVEGKRVIMIDDSIVRGTTPTVSSRCCGRQEQRKSI